MLYNLYRQTIYTIFALLACVKLVYAEDKQETEPLKIGNWTVIINSHSCYLKSFPVKQIGIQSDQYQANVLIYYLGPEMYTIGVDPGYLINSKKDFILKTFDREFYLNVSPSDNHAQTYSSEQDVNIIDSFIRSTNDYFTVRSYNKKEEFSLDYYSLAGLKQSLQYLQFKCKKSNLS